VAEQEEVNLTEDGEKALMALSNGDMRKVRYRFNLFSFYGKGQITFEMFLLLVRNVRYCS
jgi:DNA polymerase III delta prime subunit